MLQTISLSQEMVKRNSGIGIVTDFSILYKRKNKNNSERWTYKVFLIVLLI